MIRSWKTKQSQLFSSGQPLTLALVYLFLEILDLYPMEVELVALVPHSSQQLSNAVVLGVDHLLGGNHSGQPLLRRLTCESCLEQKYKGRINPKHCIIKNNHVLGIYAVNISHFKSPCVWLIVLKHRLSKSQQQQHMQVQLYAVNTVTYPQTINLCCLMSWQQTFWHAA